MELIEMLVQLIADEYEDGAILIFLPGMAEIRGLHERLASSLDDVEKRFILIPLHSTLSSEEQRLTFSKPRPGFVRLSWPRTSRRRPSPSTTSYLSSTAAA